jgi:ThiF family
MSHLIIGAGGTASWLVPLLKRMVRPPADITVCDGDILEARNIDRQLFDQSFIGWNKAEALAELHLVKFEPAYLDREFCEWVGLTPWACIWCCADNHIARRLVLDLIDDGQAMMAIIGGNEYTDSEAYPYLSAWKGGSADPRVYYPELLTDASNDPTNPSCQGAAQEKNRQLALANYLSAGMMVHLWWFITNHGHEVAREAWPQRHMSNFAMFNTKPMS